ncbi:MAG TPA: extensin family protein [Kofleriaceae bacterium]|nr:extensin family protein [Kofleriaceae bacterium]
MDALVFRPEPFGSPRPSTRGCGCSGCRQQEAELENDDALEFEPDQGEWEADDPRLETDEPEWEVDPRKGCSPGTPLEVEACASMAAVSPVQCKPGFTKKCPALPETWKSKTIAGVPFYYGPTIQSAGGKRKQVTRDGTNKQVQIVPAAWRAAHGWITAMNTLFGMRITAVYTSGQGRYCRCVRHPKGVCREAKETWPLCTGETISDHGYGDALDIIGVRWADKKAVGSSLDTTIIHSWEDPEQSALLVRINAALRIYFHTVLDYSRSDHRDHFHCDMHQGRARPVFGESPCEPNFILSSLRRLNYVSSTRPVTWERARDALTEFAGVVNMQPPARRDDRVAWRPIVTRLYGCVALGVAGQCARR